MCFRPDLGPEMTVGVKGLFRRAEHVHTQCRQNATMVTAKPAVAVLLRPQVLTALLLTNSQTPKA
jgi:hypothetical protein